jgi:hypothetical protein
MRHELAGHEWAAISLRCPTSRVVIRCAHLRAGDEIQSGMSRHRQFKTCTEAVHDIFTFIESFYNKPGVTQRSDESRQSRSNPPNPSAFSGED